MVALVFEPAGFEVDVDVGSAIVDVTDAHPAADVPYSCRAATCGTCRVYVVTGAEGLSTPEQDELEVLAMFDDDPTKVRLCCQARIVDNVDRVVLKVVDD